eukprot:gene38965-44174_t
MVAGHESVSSGDVVFGNTNVTTLPPAQRGTAMMFQSYALFPHLDLVDNVAFSLKMKGVDKETRRREAMEMLKLMQLEPYIRMRAELKKLQTSLGITFVHVTHSQEEAMALADLIVVMNEGRIEQADTPRAVFERPATAFVARFMGDHNVLSGRIVERTADGLFIEVVGGGRFFALGAAPVADDTADIAIRTDHVRIGAAPADGLGFD